MTRIKILAALVAIACLSLSVAAYQQAGRGQAQARVVDVDKLRDNLYVLKGGGGNTAVFIAANGVVVVDTKNPGWGQPILEKIKTLTDKPVTTIINTHTHGDHVSGNVEFPATVEVIVHENTKANMMEMRGATGIPQQGPPTNIFKEHNGLGLPKRTFKDKMSIGNGNDRIDLFYFGRGHTNGDAFVYFPALKVLHTGDMFTSATPLIDYPGGGSVVEWTKTLDEAMKLDFDTVIPGHGPVTNKPALLAYRNNVEKLRTRAASLIREGKSQDDVGKVVMAEYGWADGSLNMQWSLPGMMTELR